MEVKEGGETGARRQTRFPDPREVLDGKKGSL